MGSVSLPFRCGGPTVDTAGDEAWPKHLKEACSPEESSEAPFSFFCCCSSYERMDCRASCFLCTSTLVIIGGGHHSQVRNNISSTMKGVEGYLDCTPKVMELLTIGLTHQFGM